MGGRAGDARGRRACGEALGAELVELIEPNEESNLLLLDRTEEMRARNEEIRLQLEAAA